MPPGTAFKRSSTFIARRHTTDRACHARTISISLSVSRRCNTRSRPRTPELEAVRSRVLEVLDRRLPSEPPSRAFRLHPAFVYAGQAVAAALVGYLLGAAHRPFSPGNDPGRDIVGMLARDAARPGGKSGGHGTPYLLTSIRVVDSDRDHVEITGIAGQEIRLRLDRGDPLLEREIVQPWLAEGLLYQRLKAVQLAVAARNTATRDALIYSMRNDPSSAVRLAATTRLAGMPRDAAVLESLLGILSSEAPVTMKLAATDCLVKYRTDPSRITAALEAGDPATSRPVLIHARRYLSTYSD